MENEPTTTRSKIFSSPEEAYEWFDHHELLPKTIGCDKCGGTMNIQHDSTYMNRYRYRCNTYRCGKSCGLFDSTLFKSPRIPIHEYLFLLFSWISKGFTYDTNENSEVSESSFFRVKKIIYQLIKKQNEKDYKTKIGGFEEAVQIDETVIIKGQLHTNPSEMKDGIKGSTWLVGCVEERTNELRIEIVPDRKLKTMKKFFKKFIKKKTIVKSDGHKSYPGSVEHIDGEHIVVNHEEGFKNKEGYTTNRIEGVWGVMKYDITLRKGVKNSAIPNFLEEFKWRRKNIPSKSRNSSLTKIEKMKAFKKLVELFINN